MVSSGPATGPTPTAITLQLGQFIITAGTSLSFTDVPVDAGGSGSSNADVQHYSRSALRRRNGSDDFQRNDYTTDSTTRGVYTLTCSLTSPALTASGSFTVLLPADPTTNTQQATFAAFSATTTMTSTILKQVNIDLAAGNQSAVNADLAALSGSFERRRFNALAGSAAFAPEGGFPASAGASTGFGINPTEADANVGPYLSNLITAVQNLTTFLQTSPLATLTSAQSTTYSRLQTALSTLVTQLPSLNPSTYGVVANMEQEDYLFNQVLPQYYQALAQATIQYLTSNGFTASIRPRHRKGVFAADGSVDIVPVGWRAGDVQFVKTGLHTLRHGRGLAWRSSLVVSLNWRPLARSKWTSSTISMGRISITWRRPATTIIINGAVQSGWAAKVWME